MDAAHPVPKEPAPEPIDESAPAAAAEHPDVLLRLRLVHGQLGGVIHMMEQSRASAEVLTQLAAITHALHRAGYRLVADELGRRPDDEQPADRTADLERLFLALG
jgi:DNA-binding FrmR family transcriptional regulator